MDDQNKNLILATALSFLVILVWFVLFPPEDPGLTAATADEIGAPVAAPAADGTTTPQVANAAAATETATVEPAAQAPRIDINSPSLTGSLSLLGGRIDDLSLVDYTETLEEGSDLVRLLSPVGEELAYYALYGWAPAAGVAADQVPGPNTVWNVESGIELTPDSPVTLVWDNGAGLIFRRHITVDDKFLFGIEQSVENRTNAAVQLAPYGFVARHGRPDTRALWVRHEGVVGMTDNILEQITYKKVTDLEPSPTGGLAESFSAESSGWIGFTDTYWMTTLIPETGNRFTSTARYSEATNIYQVETVYATVTVEPGTTQIANSQLFAGAKEWDTIRNYENEGGIEGFLDSIDWGWFFFLTKPIFWLLHTLNGMIGNMGWSIIALTVVLKALLFPLAYKSSVSMARMKELQPEMEALKAKTGDDKAAMQQGMMKLYKENKVNPASGCVPILIQIPIFFSLYKVILVTIELYQAPWIGWIHDLAAPDPSSILNLFGLLPFAAPDPGSMFAIVSLGILPIFLGISMWVQQKLNPAPSDPTQKMIFAWMPWVFMFMLGSFASGLVL
ncbi:MAG: membrane protein insertase YidC, partial [Rhodobacteraceae bacterium]|nr:membrane protein insertase YidC [Paracoccaceae bacterium]